jgi:hypothetical protein
MGRSEEIPGRERKNGGWGVKLAAGAYCIAQAGHDCRFPLHFEKGSPSGKTLEPVRAVPGFWVPADNVMSLFIYST